jgi:hypothetical protein
MTVSGQAGPAGVGASRRLADSIIESSPTSSWTGPVPPTPAAPGFRRCFGRQRASLSPDKIHTGFGPIRSLSCFLNSSSAAALRASPLHRFRPVDRDHCTHHSERSNGMVAHGASYLHERMACAMASLPAPYMLPPEATERGLAAELLLLRTLRLAPRPQHRAHRPLPTSP